MRKNSELLLSESQKHLAGRLRLTTRALISIFGKSEHNLITSIRTIETHSTDAYIEKLIS